MKKLILLMSILFSLIIVNAQTDIIYPAEGGNIIFNCKINEVKNGNTVHFTKDSISSAVEAVAITKDGIYIDLDHYVKKLSRDKSSSQGSEQSGLYRGHDYKYYQKLYNQAKGSAGFGSFMTILGLGGTIAGTIMTLDDKVKNDETARILYIAGAISFNIGMPVWISGAVKAANNKRAMDMTKRNTNLSFRTTNHGVGLVFNF